MNQKVSVYGTKSFSNINFESNIATIVFVVQKIYFFLGAFYLEDWNAHKFDQCNAEMIFEAIEEILWAKRKEKLKCDRIATYKSISLFLLFR